MSDVLELYVRGIPLDGGTYHYVESGLENVYLLNGFTVETDEDYGRLVSFRNVDDLHAAIGVHLFESEEDLTPPEFKFLRRQMRLTQVELGRMFGLDQQTIANYEKGTTPITKLADRHLRMKFILSIMPQDMRAGFLKQVAGLGSDLRTEETSSDRRMLVKFWEECGHVIVAGLRSSVETQLA